MWKPFRRVADPSLTTRLGTHQPDRGLCLAAGNAVSGLSAFKLNDVFLSAQYRTNRQVTPTCSFLLTTRFFCQLIHTAWASGQSRSPQGVEAVRQSRPKKLPDLCPGSDRRGWRSGSKNESNECHQDRAETRFYRRNRGFLGFVTAFRYGLAGVSGRLCSWDMPREEHFLYSPYRMYTRRSKSSLFLNPWVEQFHTSRIYLSSQA